MKSDFTARTEIRINANAGRVWAALTDPVLIKQYLFGTEAVSDWKKGSAISYQGVWEGKPYEDKGMILELEPNKRLVTTFWSSLSGVSDKPENYNRITWELRAAGDFTTLSLEQDNNPTREAADHSAANWKMVLQKMKDLLEE